jgi:glycosyltransferase involved in cell wall biosynthesis
MSRHKRTKPTNNMGIKVLFCIDSLARGGKERQLLELLKVITKRDDLICELVLKTRRIHFPGVDRLAIKIHSLNKENSGQFGTFIRFYRIVKQSSPDIIHTLDTVNSFYVSILKIFRKHRFIDGSIRWAPPRGALSLKLKMLYRFNFFFADRIVANSRAGILSLNPPPKKSTVIYNGFDFRRIEKLDSPKEIRTIYGIATPKVVGMVANFTNSKDYRTLLFSARDVLRQRRDVTYVLVGDGPNLVECQQSVEREHRDYIKFTGSLEEVESIINVFDIGVLVSTPRLHGEGISNSVMEYMALGKSVIVTAGGGNSEIVRDNINGFIVSPEDHEALSRKTIELLDNQELRRKLGEEGKKAIYENFSVNKMASEYLNLYRSMLRE